MTFIRGSFSVFLELFIGFETLFLEKKGSFYRPTLIFVTHRIVKLNGIRVTGRDRGVRTFSRQTVSTIDTFGRRMVGDLVRIYKPLGVFRRRGVLTVIKWTEGRGTPQGKWLE